MQKIRPNWYHSKNGLFIILFYRQYLLKCPIKRSLICDEYNWNRIPIDKSQIMLLSASAISGKAIENGQTMHLFLLFGCNLKWKVSIRWDSRKWMIIPSESHEIDMEGISSKNPFNKNWVSYKKVLLKW